MPVGRNWPESHGAQAEALRRAFPAYSVFVSAYGGQRRFELITTDDSNPWCLISDDALEIWHELKGARCR